MCSTRVGKHRLKHRVVNISKEKADQKKNRYDGLIEFGGIQQSVWVGPGCNFQDQHIYKDANHTHGHTHTQGEHAAHPIVL